jgi:DNA-binding MarR family transcriptional regulator
VSRSKLIPLGDAKGRLLGALLRNAYQNLAHEVMAATHATGFGEFQALHGNLLHPLWAQPDGLRITELASKARMTKQSMGAIVDQLEGAGCVERVDDPSDGRAKLVRLTKRGREGARVARAAVVEVEAEWSRRIGAERIAELKSILSDLLASLESDADAATSPSAS